MFFLCSFVFYFGWLAGLEGHSLVPLSEPQRRPGYILVLNLVFVWGFWIYFGSLFFRHTGTSVLASVLGHIDDAMWELNNGGGGPICFHLLRIVSYVNSCRVVTYVSVIFEEISYCKGCAIAMILWLMLQHCLLCLELSHYCFHSYFFFVIICAMWYINILSVWAR